MKKHIVSTSITWLLLGLSSPLLAGGAADHAHATPNSSASTLSKCTQEHADLGHCTRPDEHSSHTSAAGHVATSENKVSKTIRVALNDNMRFDFSEPPTAKTGDTLRFIVTNKGRIPHEFAIGTLEEQVKHRAMMRKNPTMAHEDGSTVSLAPGQQKTLTWVFKGEGLIEYACNIPGHYEAGMYHQMSLQPTQ